jgi:hypothetical protein
MNLNRLPRLGRVALVAVAALAGSHAAAATSKLPEVEFENEPKLTTNEGHVSLRWEGNGDPLAYEVQSDDKRAFPTPTRIYRGTDERTFLSGLADGRYFFRVRARPLDAKTWGPWSSPVELLCEHHSLALAWTLFGSGGLLFALIVAFVTVNARHLDRFERNDA